MISEDKAKIYTFYSYKGGVGRSMALANVAELLYRQGLRVLMIDFDLEAPGLEQYFFERESPKLQELLCQRGVIDLLFSYRSLRSLSDSSQVNKLSELPSQQDVLAEGKEQSIPIEFPPSYAPLSSFMADAAGVSIEQGPEWAQHVSVVPEVEEKADDSGFPYPVEPLSGFINTIYPARQNMTGTLSIITAGRRAKEQLTPEGQGKETKDAFALYADRVRSFAWDDFYLNFDGERFFDWFREEAVKNVDIVIIDSRTGVAEMSGVCTYQLADVVVMFVAANNQNIDGIKKVAESLTNRDLISEGRKGRELSIILVPSRVDLSEKLKLDDLSVRFRQVADKLTSPAVKFVTNSFVDLRIPYISYYSFVEEIAARDSESPAAHEMVKAFERICRSIAQIDSKVMAKVNFDTRTADNLNLVEQQTRVANQVFSSLGLVGEVIARSLLTRLVRLAQVAEGDVKDSPKNVKLDDLDREQKQIVEKFIDARVLVINQDERDQATVGFANEDLINNWTNLKEWINLDREFLLWRQDLQSALTIWEKNGRNRSDLMAESRLDEAKKWLNKRPEDLNKPETEYIKASLSSRRKQLLKNIIQVPATVAVLGLLGFAINYYFPGKSSSATEKALSRQLALHSESVIATQPELSVLLAIEATRVSATDEALKALRDVLLQSHLRTVIRVGNSAYSARFSHNGQRIVITSGGPAAQIWQQVGSSTWRKLAVLSSDSDVTGAAFSPDDRLIATLERLGLSLWNATKENRVALIQYNARQDLGSRGDLAFSPDGLLVSATSLDGVKICDVKTMRGIQTLTGGVNSVSFSPDGKYLAAGGNNNQIRVWETSTWKEITAPLVGHTESVTSVRFSPDSSLLVTTGGDNTARVWSTGDWKPIRVFSEHTGKVNAAGFSPDGKLVVSGSDDRTAMVWEATTAKRVLVLRGSGDDVYDASFSPDGKLILTAGKDTTARLWDLNVDLSESASTTEMISLGCARVTRNMTQEEWQKYMSKEKYRATCSNIPLPEPSTTTQASLVNPQ